MIKKLHIATLITLFSPVTLSATPTEQIGRALNILGLLGSVPAALYWQSYLKGWPMTQQKFDPLPQIAQTFPHEYNMASTQSGINTCSFIVAMLPPKFIPLHVASAAGSLYAAYCKIRIPSNTTWMRALIAVDLIKTAASCFKIHCCIKNK
jgi:hypothetical protein